MDNPKPSPREPAMPPTQAEIDAMTPFERFKWITRHIMSAPKDAVSNPFHSHDKNTPSTPPRSAGD